MNNKAFTIIELLVVIAIIIFLATIINYGIAMYINKAKDDSLKGKLASLIPLAENYYNNQNNYSGFCGNDPGDNSPAAPVFAEIDKLYPSTDQPSNHRQCGVTANPAAWAACSKLFSNSSFFCVDSSGNQKEISSCGAGITVCQ